MKSLNLAEKAFCRVFQFGFKVAIPLLPYRDPKILNSIGQIPDTLKAHQVRSVLLVTDAGIRGLGLTRHLEELLDARGFHVTVYDQVQTNPTVSQVDAAHKLYVEHHCEATIGFGGGSSMDVAKAVGVLIARPDKTLADLGGILKVWKRTPLMIAIPTTAGTGSETTLAAVISDPETKHKYAVMDFPLTPDVAVLDPETTRTLPPAITAGTGMDTLVHAIEAYIGRSTTRKTRRESLQAVRLVFGNLERAYRNGNDMQARRSMMRASYLGGCAFTVSYVGYCHAVSHSLSARYNVPHGQTCGILLPYVLEAYGTAIYPQLKALGVAAGVCGLDTEESYAAQLFLKAVRDLARSVGIPETIPGIRKADIPILARQAAKEGNPVYPVPVLMSAEELQQFYYDVYEGE